MRLARSAGSSLLIRSSRAGVTAQPGLRGTDCASVSNCHPSTCQFGAYAMIDGCLMFSWHMQYVQRGITLMPQWQERSPRSGSTRTLSARSSTPAVQAVPPSAVAVPLVSAVRVQRFVFISRGALQWCFCRSPYTPWLQTELLGTLCHLYALHCNSLLECLPNSTTYIVTCY
jgi:hypothetical protein